MLPFGLTIPATVPQRSEIPDGLMNYSVFSVDCKFDSKIRKGFVVCVNTLRTRLLIVYMHVPGV